MAATMPRKGRRPEPEPEPEAPEPAALRAHWTAQQPLVCTPERSAAAMADALIVAEAAAILRRRPDAEAAGVRVLSESPLVYVVDDFLTAGECEHIVGLAEPQMARAVVTGAKGNTVTSDRTSRVAWLPDPTAETAAEDEVDEVLVEVEERVCALLGCRPECTEPFQVIHYRGGEEYSDHVDGYDSTSEHGLANCARGGNRLVTTLMYLNDVDEGSGGGETNFSELEISVQPRQGRILVFVNCTPDSPAKVDPRTLHAGRPVLEGEKWAANKWLRMFPLRSEGEYDYVRSVSQ